jgi:hypothetical protein
LRFIFLFAALLAALGLEGCAAGGSPIVQTMRALLSTGGTGVSQTAIPDAPDLRFSYLRVQVPGHPPGLMVLGYVDTDPAGPIEVWYSANRETLRLQNGRVISTTGTIEDWSAVHYAPAPPAWSDVTVAGTSYERQRDAMPGYRYGIREQIRVQAWPALHTLPPLELPASLPAEKAAGYRWYRESVLPQPGQATLSTVALPGAWFAWGKHRGVSQIVYSEQCLSPEFCLKLQRWPLLEEAN